MPESAGFQDAVGDAMKMAEATAIAPRFRKLASGDVEEKAPGELVTVADQHCEQLLTAALRALRPIPVVGEEATASDADLVHLVNSEPAVWLVDPLDGTKNFAAGSPDYAVMVALVERGATVASWIWRPHANSMATATLGGGAQLNGQAVALPATSHSDTSPVATLETARGVVLDRFFTPALRAHVDALIPASRRLPERCAGVEYPELPSGRADFLVYWRTLPWDHAPGALFATESGFVTSRPDGSPYAPGQQQSGLLVSHPALAAELGDVLWTGITNGDG